jgi:Kef-type K+ transport system membrane component KefB
MALTLALAVIFAAAHLLGRLARRLHQPAVTGHLVAGILLGASGLGALSARLPSRLIAPDTRPVLSLIGQIALILFMFSLGYELDRVRLRRHVAAVPLVAAMTFAVPLGLGAATAVALAPWYRPPATRESAFILLIAVSVAVTALPVLAAIVRERGLTQSLPATVAMTSAAIIDALCWSVLAVALLGTGAGPRQPWPLRAALLAAWALAMVAVVRPGLRALVAHRWVPRSLRLAPVVAVALTSGWLTTELGLHAILGAFFAGLLMPGTERGQADPGLLVPLRAAGMALLPVFIVLAGFSTDVAALDSRDLAALALVLVVAVAGKLGVGWASARMGGLSRRDATMVGVLLNTRGVTELIVLSVGRQAGIINGHLYTVFVLMALLTSAATGPLLAALQRGEARSGSRSQPEEAWRPGPPGRPSVQSSAAVEKFRSVG